MLDLQWQRWSMNLKIYGFWCLILTLKQRILCFQVLKRQWLPHHHPLMWRILLCHQMYLAVTLLVESFHPSRLDRKRLENWLYLNLRLLMSWKFELGNGLYVHLSCWCCGKSLLNLHYNLFWKTNVLRAVDGLMILAVTAPRATQGVPILTWKKKIYI